MSRWWRAHDDAVDNPKLCLLSDKQHRAWFNLMCLASANDGALPDMKVIALKLRMSAAKAGALLGQLKEAGLFDDGDGGATPHNWSRRQFKSDVADPTGADRQQRYRDRHRNDESNAVTTVTDKRTETETENRKAESTPSGVTTSKSYAFENGIIRLAEKDFSKWREAFSHLDLKAELIALTPWAEQQGNRWFHAVAGALAKRNREVKAGKDKAKTEPGFKWNGIEGVI